MKSVRDTGFFFVLSKWNTVYCKSAKLTIEF